MTAPRSVSSRSSYPEARGPFFLIELRHWLDPVLADPLRKAAWGELTFKAAWIDTDTLRRGQIRTSLPALASEWGWPYGRVQRFLAALQKAGLIDLATEGRGESCRSVITLRHLQQSPSAPRSRRTPDEIPDEIPDESARPPSRVSVATSAIAPRPPDESIDESTDEPKETRCGLDGFLGPRSEPRDVVTFPRENDDHPEMLAYVERLIDALNYGQTQNGHLHQAILTPVQYDQRASLTAVHAIRAAGVDVEFAERYVRTEAARYDPQKSARKEPQIKSLAYLRGGLLIAWAKRRQLELPIARPVEPPNCQKEHKAISGFVPAFRDRTVQPRRGGDPDKLDELLERLATPLPSSEASEVPSCPT